MATPGAAPVGVVGGLIGIFIVGWLVVQCSKSGNIDNPPEKPQKTQAQLAVEEATCKQDLQCWGEKNSAAAEVYCKEHVEKLAKYSSRWTDGFLEPKFSRFRWLNKAQGTVTYIGDKIEFQNGFGAYQTHIYECDFNPSGHVIIDVRASPGRL